MKNRTHDKILIREARQIKQFVMNHFVKDPTYRGTTTSDAFDSYKKFVKKNNLPKCDLSLDGFGRLLPKVFERKPVHYADNKVLKTLIHVRVTE